MSLINSSEEKNLVENTSNSLNNIKEEHLSKFHIPLKWKKDNIDKVSLLEYLIQLKLKQIHIKNFDNFPLENDQNSQGELSDTSQSLKIPEIIEGRIFLVDFLAKICKKFSLKNETFFQAVSIFDFFLSKTTKNLENFEEMKFIAIICLSISCKFEEINCNYLIFFHENLLDKNKYSIKDLISKELEILQILNFNINFPNFYSFNNIFIQIAILFIYENSEEKNFNRFLNAQKSLVNDLLLHNDFIAKKFVGLKESIFSSALNSGIVCFKMTLLSLKFSGNLNAQKINDFVDKEFLNLVMKGEYLLRCDIVASNIFKFLYKKNLAQNLNQQNLNEQNSANFSNGNNMNSPTNNNNNNNENSEDVEMSFIPENNEPKLE